ncbi:MAG: methyltransferase [Deltaproteobacteria bacterium]|nr:methyltransferase [Deltaproteobacteria bacterium]
MPPLPPDLTEDAMLGGRIKVLQPRRGYRFSIDAVALARFIPAREGQVLVDLGTGCGVIPLAVAALVPGLSAVGVEIQEELAAVAAENVRLNAMEDRVSIVHGDFSALPLPGVPARADLVCANPPYLPPGTGRVNPDKSRALARHEIAGCLADAAAAAKKLLSPGGSFFAVYPSERLAHLLSTVSAHSLEPKRLRTIHTRAADPASLVLLQADRNAHPGLVVDPPLVLYQDSGEYTPETRAMLYPE